MQKSHFKVLLCLPGILLLFCCLPNISFAEDADSSKGGLDLNLWREEKIAALRTSRGPEARALKHGLLIKAKLILHDSETYSVTFNERTPPSGDIRDYYSTGPYWWPDPEAPDGLPYIRRDGEFNPERDRVSDRAPLHSMIRDVKIMALTYALTGERAYAAHGQKLLYTWFLDPTTGMNPNLQHAQAIPGKTDGRGTGIIDSHPFAELGDAMLILETWEGGDPDIYAGLRKWFTEFSNWLQTHPNANDERAATNNHGTAFDLQHAGILAYLGEDEALAELLENSTKGRIASQIEPDGTQPYELKRTRTWSYCTENLEHFFKLARLGEEVGVDLYHYEAPTGASLEKALAYVLPAACDRKAWAHEQATEWQDEFIRNVAAIVGDKYGEATESATECLWSSSIDPLPELLRAP